MKTKKFKLTTHDAPDFSAVVEIKPTKAAQTDMRGCIAFFHDLAEHLDQFDGNLEVAFLEVIGPELWESIVTTRSIGMAIHEMARREGFPPLDGSRGIRLVECEAGRPDNLDVEEL